MLKAAILAGGFGKRLRPLTDRAPKPLIKVHDKPLLDWQLLWLKGQGVGEAVLCVGHLNEKIIEHVRGRRGFGMKVEYALEEEPLGTGGALKNAEALLAGEERFLVLNGDVVTDLAVKRLWEEMGGCVGGIALVPLPSPYGVIEVREDELVERFREKPKLHEYWINAGVYCFSKEVLSYLPERGNIETSTLPRLAEEGRLRAVKYEGCYWRSIDSHKDVEEASRELRESKIFG